MELTNVHLAFCPQIPAKRLTLGRLNVNNQTNERQQSYGIGRLRTTKTKRTQKKTLHICRVHEASHQGAPDLRAPRQTWCQCHPAVPVPSICGRIGRSEDALVYRTKCTSPWRIANDPQGTAKPESLVCVSFCRFELVSRHI